MPKQSIQVMVEGGKASAGPPLGPALGPLGVPVQNIISEINKKTASFEGMQVPVTVKVDPATKEFEIEVGSPPVSALLKKEAGVEKGTGDGSVVGNVSLEQVVKIAKSKMDQMNASTLKAAVKEVVGSCVSIGLTVDGKDPRELVKEIDSMDIE